MYEQSASLHTYKIHAVVSVKSLILIHDSQGLMKESRLIHNIILKVHQHNHATDFFVTIVT